MKSNQLRSAIALIAVMCAARVGLGQLVGPIPAPTPSTPEYVPPEARVMPQVEAPKIAPLAPSIVHTNAEGRLVSPAGTPEQAAVAVYPFDDEQREKIATSTKKRLTDLERFVVQNLDKVLAARRMTERVEGASGFSQLFEARDATAALHFERLIDRLERDRAITLAQRLRLDEALLAYAKARKEEIQKLAGEDPSRTAILSLRQTFVDATRESFESLDRQVNGLVDGTALRAGGSARGLCEARVVERIAGEWLGKGERSQHGSPQVLFRCAGS
jgi:hypothetical protein